MKGSFLIGVLNETKQKRLSYGQHCLLTGNTEVILLNRKLRSGSISMYKRSVITVRSFRITIRHLLLLRVAEAAANKMFMGEDLWLKCYITAYLLHYHSQDPHVLVTTLTRSRSMSQIKLLIRLGPQRWIQHHIIPELLPWLGRTWLS